MTRAVVGSFLRLSRNSRVTFDMIIIIYPFVLYTFSLSLSILTTKPVPLCWSSFI